MADFPRSLPSDPIYGLATTPAGSRWFAAYSSGLYTSTNRGRSWHYAYQRLIGDQALPTACVAPSPAYEQDGIVLAGVSGAILRSTNGGEDWQAFKFQAPFPLVTALAFSPDFAHDATAFAITAEDGVYCSYDGGDTWTAWNFGLLDANAFCLAVSPAYARDRTLYVGTSSGLFRSANGGRGWQAVSLPVGYRSVLSLAVDGEILWIGTETSGLLRAVDGGRAWLPTYPSRAAVNALQTFPSHGLLAAIFDQTLFRSGDQGASFSPWPDANPNQFANAAVASLCPADHAGQFLLACDSQVVAISL